MTEGTSLAVALPLAGVLLWAGLEKLRTPRAFRGTLAELLPGWSVSAVSCLVPVAELMVGSGLLLAANATWPVLGVVLLGILFASAGVAALLRGKRVTCSCFGAGAHTLGWREIVILPVWLVAAYLFERTEPAWTTSDGIQYLAALVVILALIRAGMVTRLWYTAIGNRNAIAESATVRRPMLLQTGGIDQL